MSSLTMTREQLDDGTHCHRSSRLGLNSCLKIGRHPQTKLAHSDIPDNVKSDYLKIRKSLGLLKTGCSARYNHMRLVFMEH